MNSHSVVPAVRTLWLTLALGGWATAAAWSAETGSPDLFTWRKLPSIPDDFGFAGPAAGVYQNALIVAGGANFPDGRPWDGARKKWHDRVFVLRGSSWQLLAQRLPQPRAYAVSLTTPDGVAVIGGSDSSGYFRDAFLMRVHGGELQIEPLPPLPRATSNACGALLDNVIYIAGGQLAPDATDTLNQFLALDLGRPTNQRAWQSLPTWPGSPRMLAMAGVQSGAFYLMGGVDLQAGAAGEAVRTYLRDAYQYTPQRGWKRIADMPLTLAAAPTPLPAIGSSHLVVLGGCDGRYDARVAELKDAHPGCTRDAFAYHTITDTWTTAGKMPFALVTTPAVMRHGEVIIPGGEERPGVRSTDVWSATVSPRRAEFGALNLAVLGIYPAIMLAIGAWCARKAKSAEGFFRASQQIPPWAAGVSIFATMLSSITFMAVPAKAYVSNWWYIMGQVGVVVLAPVIIIVYLPFFRQLNLTSAYEYLEHRFNLAVRWFGSASFIVFQIARTGIVLYLPALALATVSSLDTSVCIVAMGLLTIAITVLGGMEAVIWTDVAQTFILVSAALLSVLVILTHLDGGLMQNVEIAVHGGKVLPAIPWSGAWTIESGWVILLGTLFSSLISYTSNQEVVQRYMSTHDQRGAARAIWINALMTIPAGMLFFAVGTALFLFYRQHPAQLDPGLARNDAIFPYFMVHELPAGVAGFVVAGIFAAAQPTSGLNSVATAVVADFYKRTHPHATPQSNVRMGRLATVVTGVLGIVVALFMDRYPVQSLWELFLNTLGLTTGILAGLFSLGILTRRATSAGALCGIAVSAATLWAVAIYGHMHPLMFGCVSVVSSFIGGYLFSLVLPGARKNLDRLTIHTANAWLGANPLSSIAVQPAIHVP